MQELASDLFKLKKSKNLPFSVSKSCADSFLNKALDFITPGMARKNYLDEASLTQDLLEHNEDLIKILKVLDDKIDIKKVVSLYQKEILVLSKKVEADAKAMHEGDPAAKTFREVLVCYPGLYAVSVYRLAHFFYQQNVPLLPRVLSEIAHEKTGIDIHPAAKIGESFFIDHGTGIVIGESAEIGNFVKIYQGVTLGALSVDKSLAQTKRHPTIQDHCVIYSHATILGGETVIGAHSVIGGNVWMTKSVAPHSVVYHKSEVKLDKNKNAEFIHAQEELSYEI